MSSSSNATSGRSNRRSWSARSPSSASPTTWMRGSAEKLTRSARRKSRSLSPISKRMGPVSLSERGAGTARPLRSSGGVGEVGLVCIGHRLFVQAGCGTRSHLGTSPWPRRSHVPEWDLAERLVGARVFGMTKIRVLVAENHPSVRENLRYLINAEPDMQCVAVAKNGRQCIELCRQLLPEILVVDEILPGADGLA